MVENPPRARKINAWNLFKIILALALMLIVLSQLRWEDLTALWQRLSLVWLPASVALFWGVTWASARRYWSLIRKQVSLRQVFSTVIFQTVLTNFVGTIAGAASYVALLRTRSQVQVGRGVASIVLARLGDLMILLPLLVISSALVWARIENIQLLVIALGLGLLLGITLALGILVGRGRVLQQCHALTRRFGIHENKWVKRGLEPVAELAQLDSKQLGRALGELILLSVLVIGFSLLFAVCNINLFGLALTLPEIIFLNVFAILISYIPIQVFGGLGIYEVTSIYLYGLFGIAPSVMIPFVISARLYSFLLNGMLLLYPLLIQSAENKSER